MLRLAVVVGTRPEIIRVSTLINHLKKEEWIEFQVWVTGQHYSYGLSTIFEEELAIHSDRNFEVGSGSPMEQIGKIMVGAEQAFIEYKPDLVLVDGDSNSVLGVALAAKKLSIPIGHIEAGLREQSYDGKVFSRKLTMNNYPEEMNRIIVDNCSELLFAPTKDAIKNLESENILGKVLFVGDLGKEILFQNLQNVQKGDYTLVTIHRPENTDDGNHLKEIIDVLVQSEVPIIFPMHPRMRKALEENMIEIKSDLIDVREPVGYFEMVNLMAGAKLILTDSGGVSREAFHLKVPCLTLRKNSCWVETIECGANKLVKCEDLIEELRKPHNFPHNTDNIFGLLNTSSELISFIKEWWKQKNGGNINRYRILIGSLFCNEDHSIDQYVSSLLELDYPKELIDVVWVENNSSDNTKSILQHYYYKLLKEYNYHSIKFYSKIAPFGPLPKEHFGMERSGKVAETKISWEERGKYHLMLHNFLFDKMTDEHDFILFWFADAIPEKPDFLKRLIRDMEIYSDAGWFGGVQYERFPRHRRCHCGDVLDRHDSPWYYGLEAPYLKFTDLSDLVNTPANKQYNLKQTKNGTNGWNIPYGYPHYWYLNMKKNGYSFFIRIIEEEEILARQKAGRGVFCDICSTPHIFLIPRIVVKNGLRWRIHDGETSIAIEIDLAKMGYKMYCDSYVFFRHISVDGKIWRDHLGPEWSPVEREFMEKNFGPEWTEKDYFDTIEEFINPSSVFSKNYRSIRAITKTIQEKKSSSGSPHPSDMVPLRHHHRKSHPHP